MGHVTRSCYRLHQLVCFVFPNSRGPRELYALSFHKLCVDMHVNQTKFERKSSLGYYHMTCIGKTKHASKTGLFPTGLYHASIWSPSCQYLSCFYLLICYYWTNKLVLKKGAFRPTFVYQQSRVRQLGIFMLGMCCWPLRTPTPL